MRWNGHAETHGAANAALIAAAPQLLAALEALIGTNGDLYSDNAHVQARAAIARARNA